MRDKTATERRQIFRVRVAGARVDAHLNGVSRCTVVDANSEGLAVVASHRASLIVGEIADVRVRYNGEEFSGRARVMNLAQLDSGRRRYGLQVLEDQAELRRGLRQMAINVQREQLRRQAGRR